MNPPAPDHVRIFDTTLRDGEQSPGCSMTAAQKLRFAHALADLGVDIIETGFPISSDADASASVAIAREVRGPTLAALARCHPDDIDTAARVLESADKPRLHVFISTSPLHREHKLGMDREQVLQVLRLVDLNEYKRRQAPIGPRITRRGFGRDRRYPITSGWTIGD